MRPTSAISRRSCANAPGTSPFVTTKCACCAATSRKPRGLSATATARLLTATPRWRAARQNHQAERSFADQAALRDRLQDRIDQAERGIADLDALLQTAERSGAESRVRADQLFNAPAATSTPLRRERQQCAQAMDAADPSPAAASVRIGTPQSSGHRRTSDLDARTHKPDLRTHGPEPVALIEFFDVSLAPLDKSRLSGFYLDFPKTGTTVEAAAVAIRAGRSDGRRPRLRSRSSMRGASSDGCPSIRCERMSPACTLPLRKRP